MSTQVFVNLPVKHLGKSVEFYARLGFTFNPQLTNEKAACIALTENSFVMLLTEAEFKAFTPKQICDATKSTAVTVALTRKSRTEVDEIVRKAVAAGGSTWKGPAGQRFHVQPRIPGSGRTYLGASIHGARPLACMSRISMQNPMEELHMEARITMITIGVDDLERSLKFYRDGLGLETEGIIGKEFEYGAVAFFELQAGVKLAIWPRQSISRDTGIPVFGPSPTELTLGHNVATKEEVDAVMEQAKKAGAVVIKPPQKTFWGGYAGYFQDPDQHLWEVAWNPHQWELQD